MLLYICLMYTKLDLYPSRSADYWGFQQGMRQIVDISVEKQSMYDEILITGYFNSPQSLLSFYNYGEKCRNCRLGGVTSYDTTLKQLFFIRQGELESIREEMKDYEVNVLEEVLISNGQVEYLAIEITEKLYETQSLE